MPSKWLIHTHISSNPQEKELVINLDEYWFRIPPNEPFEVDLDSNGRQLPSPEFYAFHILNQYGPIYGITEIKATKTRSGVQLDIEPAQEQAARTLLMNRHRHINLWAQEQLQSRINKNLPVMPPTGFVEESIKALNFDLGKTYRIYPIGWDREPEGDPNIHRHPQAQATVDPNPYIHDQEMQELKAQNDRLEARINKLMEAMGVEEDAV